jgi:hypothetical protein
MNFSDCNAHKYRNVVTNVVFRNEKSPIFFIDNLFTLRSDELENRRTVGER